MSLELKAREVEIIKIERMHHQGNELTIRVLCSKGTYIRSLARDLGEIWGCGAYLKALKRTAIGTIPASRAFHLHDFDAFLQINSTTLHADLP